MGKNEKTRELIEIVNENLDYVNGDGNEEFIKFVNNNSPTDGDIAILEILYTVFMAGKLLKPDLYKEVTDLAEKALSSLEGSV